MPDRILTSHAGSLPRPEELVALNLKRGLGELDDEAGYQAKLTQAVADVVARQRELGIDLVNDGEYGHSMGHRYDYGPWWTYVFQRLGGLELVTDGVLDIQQAPGKPGELSLASFAERRDWLEFSDAYGDPNSGAALPNPDIGTGAPVCRGPITYTGREALDRDIANLKAALDAAGLQDGYMNSVAPGSCARFGNEFYEDDQALMYACADALREEYQAIIEAGLVLQLDDPAIAENWDQINPEPSVEDYQRFTMLRVEALNHAIRGLPEDRIRFHLCWGSWHGPHVTDIPMRDIVDVMLKINAGAYSFEAANVRHEHEWRVWQDVALPEGKVILPGVVSHSTNVVEHPEVVADRIVRFAEGAGRENVVASTDCGLGGRVHPQIAWAKLGALSEGARLASRQLWGSGVPASASRMGSLRLTTTLQARGPAAAVVLDDEQVATIGEGAKRFPVAATIGDYTWRTTVTRMGGEFLLGMNKDVRKGAGAEAGDTVDVLIELDEAPREVEVPEALSAALAGDPVAREKYDGLAFTHRKEFARWIAEARKEETRDRRVTQALEMLHEGRTRS